MRSLTSLILFLLSFGSFAYDYGIDRLDEKDVASKLAGKNLAVLTHAAARSKTGVHLIDSLHQKFFLKKIFAPEHGLRTMADDWVGDGVDETTGLPVISLYKRGSRAPRAEDLSGIDAIVVDLQDVGVRYYTYFSTIAEVMKAIAPLNIELILLDRPNLLGGILMEGKVLDPALAGNFVAYHTVPTRHGMTLGELALMVNEEKKIGTRLTIIPVTGWKRESLLQESDRPWLAPSPALVDIQQVGLYALWGTLENFNLAVGRGQTNEWAFKVLGAPWISLSEAKDLARELNALGFGGAQFTTTSWLSTRSMYQGEKCNGVMLEWDNSEIRSDEFTYKISSVLFKMFKDRVSLNQMATQIYGSKSLIEAIKNGTPWEEYQPLIDEELKTFEGRRQKFLLY